MKNISPLAATVSAVLISCVSLHARGMTKEDSRIESAVKDSYAFRHYLKGDHVKVHSQDGAVTLTGTVSSSSHDAIAYQTASNVSGVKTVWDSLKVTGKQPTENSDAWLEAKIKSVLLFHSHVSVATHVTVKDGNVTLTGKADNAAEKDLTTEYVKDVEGVKSVDNDMKVVGTSKKKETMGAKIDDATITAEVKVTLLSHRSTSAVNTHVETDKGVVTLTGKADNAAEKDLVTKLVEDIDGVKSVDNNMTY